MIGRRDSFLPPAPSVRFTAAHAGATRGGPVSMILFCSVLLVRTDPDIPHALVARRSGSASAPRRARLPSTSGMECPTAPRVILLRLRCDRYVRCGVRVGDGGVVTDAFLSSRGPGAVAAAPLPP